LQEQSHAAVSTACLQLLSSDHIEADNAGATALAAPANHPLNVLGIGAAALLHRHHLSGPIVKQPAATGFLSFGSTATEGNHTLGVVAVPLPPPAVFSIVVSTVRPFCVQLFALFMLLIIVAGLVGASILLSRSPLATQLKFEPFVGPSSVDVLEEPALQFTPVADGGPSRVSSGVCIVYGPVLKSRAEYTLSFAVAGRPRRDCV
jgi:hypothetical protein